MSDNTSMPNYMSDLKKNNVRFGDSYATFEDLLTKYNISRLPDYENATEPYLSYIIMTRPDLNLGAKNIIALRSNAMTAAFMNDPQGFRLFKQLTNLNNSMFLPIITTRAKSYSVSDVELKTIEKGGSYFGHLVKYAKHNEEHKISNNITIDYRNDRFLSILKMHYLWMCYMYIVSKNDSIMPKDYYMKNGIIDYAGSLYYLVTRRDGRELVYWEKLVGIFPTKVPFSIFSHNENMIIEDTISIDYVYGIKADPCDPAILVDINTLHGLSNTSTEALMTNTIDWKNNSTGNKRVQMNNFDAPFVKGDVFASKPYIHVMKSGGRLKYYLDFVS